MDCMLRIVTELGRLASGEPEAKKEAGGSTPILASAMNLFGCYREKAGVVIKALARRGCAVEGMAVMVASRISVCSNKGGKMMSKCLVAALVFGMLLAASAPTVAAQALGRCLPTSTGLFCEVTSDGKGFALDNSGGISFLDTYQNWKEMGLDVGPPISQRFERDGFVYQAFPGAVMQAGKAPSARGSVAFVLLTDEISMRNEDLLRQRGVPLPDPWAANIPSDVSKGEQLAYAIRNAFKNPESDRPYNIFYSTDGRYVDLAGLPLSTPKEQPDGTLVVRAQRTVLYVRPGGTMVERMDLRSEMVDAGIVPIDATVPVSRELAPTLKTGDVHVPQRTSLLPWLTRRLTVDVTVENARAEELAGRHLQAKARLTWRDTGHTEMLSGPALTNGVLQFSGTAFPPQVAAHVRSTASSRRPAKILIGVDTWLEGPYGGNPDWKSPDVSRTVELAVRRGTWTDLWDDLGPFSPLLAAVASAACGIVLYVGGRQIAVPVLLRFGRGGVGAARELAAQPNKSRETRRLQGFLFIGEARRGAPYESLEVHQPTGTVDHLLPGKVTADIPVTAGGKTVHVTVGVDKQGRHFISRSGGGTLIVNGETSGRPVELHHGSTILADGVRLRYLTHLPWARGEEGARQPDLRGRTRTSATAGAFFRGRSPAAVRPGRNPRSLQGTWATARPATGTARPSPWTGGRRPGEASPSNRPGPSRIGRGTTPATRLAGRPRPSTTPAWRSL